MSGVRPKFKPMRKKKEHGEWLPYGLEKAINGLGHVEPGHVDEETQHLS